MIKISLSLGDKLTYSPDAGDFLSLAHTQNPEWLCPEPDFATYTQMPGLVPWRRGAIRI